MGFYSFTTQTFLLMLCRLRGECVEKSPAVKRAEKLVHQIEDVKEKLQHDLAVSYSSRKPSTIGHIFFFDKLTH